MKEIVVVGSYIEALVMEVSRIPSKGETVLGHNFRRTFGGKGSNQAVQCARLGAKTSFLTMVGADASGDQLLELLDREGIDSSFVFRHTHLPTASGFILYDSDGDNIITVDTAALKGLQIAHIEEGMQGVNENSIVLVQLEIPVDMALYACGLAKRKGAQVILNPAPATDFSSSDLSSIDYLIPNETELRICLGLEPSNDAREEDLAKELLKHGCQNVVVTMGKKGSLWVSQSGFKRVPAFSNLEILDTTGAGDAFNGGFAVALSQGLGVERAMVMGNAAGGLACTVADTIPSFHRKENVEPMILGTYADQRLKKQKHSL